MANGLVNVKGVTAEEIAAVEEILDDVVTLIGATNNTGGTVSAGTIMAKLNKLLTDWTAARAGYIDAINTNTARLTSIRAGYIDKLVNFGTTSDTGGTSTAGTAMAKLNKLLTDWTTTRAGRIDTINSAIGTTANTGGTATAGTVMAKLNAIITASSGGLKVKSVQHGFIANTQTTSSTRNIPISSVVLAKSILITDTGASTGATGRTHIAPKLSSATSLTQSPISNYTVEGVKKYDYSNCNWSIVEFE